MKAFIEQLEKLSEALKDPEYLFLVLEPLLFYGIGLGVLGLIVTTFLKNEKLQMASLVVIVASSLIVLPYLGARQAAETRIEKVYKIESPARVKGFTANTQDRLEHRWIFLALATIGIATLMIGPRRNRLGFGLALACIALGIQAVNYSLWMHYQDSLAFHPNLKTNEAPVRDKLRAKPAKTPDKSDSAPSESGPDREVRPLTAGTNKP